MKYFGRKPGIVPRGSYVKEANVPFREILPMQLKQSVSGKSMKDKKALCVQEMSVLFACLKKQDFEETRCPQEIQAFQKCFESTLPSNAAKSGNQSGQKLTLLELNAFLKKFP